MNLSFQRFEEVVAHAAELAKLRAQRLSRNPIDCQFQFSDSQRMARADMERAAKADQLKGLPTCFGEFK